MAEAKRDEVPLPEKAIVDRHLPTGVVIYAYTDDQLLEYGRQCVQAALESTDAELEAMKQDVAHALMAATAEAEHADEVKAELEALRKDAERYRWLRANPVQCANAADDQTYGRKKDKPEEFDAAVDAALNQGGK